MVVGAASGFFAATLTIAASYLMALDVRHQMAEEMLAISAVLAGDTDTFPEWHAGSESFIPLISFRRQVGSYPTTDPAACTAALSDWLRSPAVALTAEAVDHLAPALCNGQNPTVWHDAPPGTLSMLIARPGSQTGHGEVSLIETRRDDQAPWLAFTLRPKQIGITLAVALMAGVFGFMLRRRQYRHYLAARLKASVDALSGVLRREEFEANLQSRIDELQVDGGSACLLAIDLDEFKSVNDRFGHAAGDEVIRRSGRLIAAALRSNDLVGRVGGEEFMVLLPNLPKHIGAEIADRLRKRIASQAFLFGAETIFVSTSIGVASLMLGDSMASLMQRADARLYRAKRSGRNRVIWEGQGSDDY